MKRHLLAGQLALAAALMLTGHAPSVSAQLPHAVFAAGDLFVSFEQGPVQWRNPDGSLNAVLIGSVPGKAEGMRLDGANNLYVAHWCADPSCTTGNTTERFNSGGMSQGTFGAGYNCNPHALVFDPAGSAYVGQADCTGSILKFAMGQAATVYAAAAEKRGAFWVDMAADGCTILYTSWGPSVKRFNVCTNTQLSDYTTAPLPSGVSQGLHVLPDGGVLVSSGSVISRLNAGGAVAQTYGVSSENAYWAGLDLVGDGTFWAINYYSSSVYRFRLDTGAVVGSFSTGAPADTAVDVRVVPTPLGALGLPFTLPLPFR